MGTKKWMAVAGAIGFSCFLVANATKWQYAFAPQLFANAFVFLTWGRGFLEFKGGFQKLVAFIGTVVPIIMASITIFRVVLPMLDL